MIVSIYLSYTYYNNTFVILIIGMHYNALLVLPIFMVDDVIVVI